MMTNGFLIVVALAGLVTLALKCAFIVVNTTPNCHSGLRIRWSCSASGPLCISYPGIFQDDIGLVNAFGPVVIDPKPIAAGIAAITFFTTKKQFPLIVGMASLYAVYWLQI